MAPGAPMTITLVEGAVRAGAALAGVDVRTLGAAASPAASKALTPIEAIRRRTDRDIGDPPFDTGSVSPLAPRRRRPISGQVTGWSAADRHVPLGRRLYGNLTSDVKHALSAGGSTCAVCLFISMF